jgi:cytoskeletal protein CcmA (bactofilin family)
MLGKPEDSAQPPAPARRFTDAVEANTTFVDSDTTITGNLVSEGNVDVAGRHHGDIRASALLRVREGARVTGRLAAKSLVVEGEVSGPALVADKVEIGATARVKSSIEARAVAIADGAFFEGEVRMDGSGGSGSPQTFTEKRKP